MVEIEVKDKSLRQFSDKVSTMKSTSNQSDTSIRPNQHFKDLEEQKLHCGKCAKHKESVLTQRKLNGVGPVDTRPSTN